MTARTASGRAPHTCQLTHCNHSSQLSITSPHMVNSNGRSVSSR
jgi:hypothetical protein